jgi:hypothetical protein
MLALRCTSAHCRCAAKPTLASPVRRLQGIEMNLVPALSWLAGLRQQRPAAPLDFADMGTAFGLDASLDASLGASPDSEPPATIPAVFMKKGRPETEAPQQQATRQGMQARR